ncbi:site-specific integrase [Oscillatoria sp. FACHB-1407]|uniref:site-specific integrase n=1 Tax=Oscillatoria sp. FACHB-1407 TaxID=2692847 RepID=UPI001685D628|nr:site-specific integrase [Oscillatoria sp. FACHB-1407]MBD2462202.1 site-specific integrase [Oscillatoria sp. FACHB-1407]
MTDLSSIDTRILQINQRLKSAQLGLQVERRGEKLSLRGTLPPRPGSDRLRPHQQRLSLNLPATPTGLKQAEQEAKIIAAQLIQNTFSWKPYLMVGGGKRLNQMDLAEQVQAFQQHFLAQSHRTKAASAKATWTTAYEPYLRKLQAIAQSRSNLSLPEAIYATVQATKANSRSRQICCTALGAFASFLDIELPTDLKSFWGNYGVSQTQARDLPSDEEILAVYDTIPNPTWRFVYGIMATYGLRNHEVFFCDYTALQQGNREASIEVLDTTKTGHHEVWPFYPDWVERFNLRQVELPPVNTDLTQTTLQRIGQLVSVQFRRYNLPFSPYDLRHAWAVRTIHIGLPDTVAARMMGHSVTVHTRTYHRWITRRDQQQAVEAALHRSQLASLSTKH